MLNAGEMKHSMIDCIGAALFDYNIFLVVRQNLKLH